MSIKEINSTSFLPRAYDLASHELWSQLPITVMSTSLVDSSLNAIKSDWLLL